MTKTALISTAELTRLAKLAKSQGVTVEMEHDGVTIRIMPFHEAARSKQDDGVSALERWKAESGWSSRESSTSKGKSGSTSPEDIVKKYYDDLGFDPTTMNDADLKRLIADAHAKWKASIPATKISKREQSALSILSEIGVGVRVLQSEVKGCGDDTLDRLDARGFVGRKPLLPPEKIKEGSYSQEEIWLLEPGMEAYLKLSQSG